MPSALVYPAGQTNAVGLLPLSDRAGVEGSVVGVFRPFRQARIPYQLTAPRRHTNTRTMVRAIHFSACFLDANRRRFRRTFGAGETRSVGASPVPLLGKSGAECS